MTLYALAFRNMCIQQWRSRRPENRLSAKLTIFYQHAILPELSGCETAAPGPHGKTDTGLTNPDINSRAAAVAALTHGSGRTQ